jgi:hypothetical protein
MRAVERTVVWEGAGDWRAEIAHLRLAPPMSARGTQIGLDYRADYQLEVSPDWVTRSLVVETAGEGWTRRIGLRRDGEGTWSCAVERRGEVNLPDAGGDMGALAGALDCDLALSPLTNLMPVVREQLHERPGGGAFLMAWVSVPDLGVQPSRQRYEHVAGGERPVVRYSDSDFTAELTLDRNGVVVHYPQLARRASLRH